MVKNAVDVILGGLSYWVFGYGLSFGQYYSNWFFAVGHFPVTAPEKVRRQKEEEYLVQLKTQGWLGIFARIMRAPTPMGLRQGHFYLKKKEFRNIKK